MSWKDRTFKHVEEVQAFPFIQWVNDGGSLEPRAERGGFACPVDQGVSIPGTTVRLHHRGGGSTEVIFTQELDVAVIRTRFAWIKDGIRQAAYTPGARGKLQALAYVRGKGGQAIGPVMLTFTGVVSRQFGNARKQFANAVRKATGGKAPAYAFWMHLEAGEVEMVGKSQKSPITSIELAGEVDPDWDYVGDETVDAIESIWGQAEKWAKAWSSPGPNGDGEMPGAEEDEEDEPAEASAGATGTPKLTLDQARAVPLPGNVRKLGLTQGTPLGKVADRLPETESLLKWLSEHGGEHYSPTVAEAARVLLDAWEKTKRNGNGEDDDIPF